MQCNNGPAHTFNLLLFEELGSIFTLLAEVFLMDTRIKHCSFMMNLTRPFEIQNGRDFSLNHLEDVNYPRTWCNG
jgi:hypothetical protein